MRADPAARRLHDQIGGREVAVRPGLPEAGDADQSDVRIHLAELRKAQSESLHDAGSEVLEYEIGAGDEFLDSLGSVRIREIEYQAALVGVQVAEEAGGFGVRHVVRKGSPGPQPVARGRLELDDIRAELGEQLSAIGRGDLMAEFENPQSAECRLLHAPILTPSRSRSVNPLHSPRWGRAHRGWTVERAARVASAAYSRVSPRAGGWRRPESSQWRPTTFNPWFAAWTGVSWICTLCVPIPG